MSQLCYNDDTCTNHLINNVQRIVIIYLFKKIIKRKRLKLKYMSDKKTNEKNERISL